MAWIWIINARSEDYEKDEIKKSFWEDSEIQNRIKNTKQPSEVNPSDYDAIFFVGGHGMYEESVKEERK